MQKKKREVTNKQKKKKRMETRAEGRIPKAMRRGVLSLSLVLFLLRFVAVIVHV